MPILEEAFASIWTTFIDVSMKLTGAALWLIAGFVIGKILGRIAKEALIRLKIDEFLSEEKYLNIKPSSLGATITRWAVYLVFIQQAAIVVGGETGPIVTFVNSVYSFVLSAVAAVVTILVGYSLAVYLKDRIITSKTIYADITGKLIFGLVLYLSVVIGLQFIKGVNAEILENILLILLGSIGIGIAIALGLGLKDVVAEMARDWLRARRRAEGRRRR
jgi:predicted permease